MDVSVVIPVYQTEKYLSQCLESILNQNQASFEIICVNDESPDGSLDILKEFERQFPQIVKIIDQKNTGGATAINNGIRASSGEYILIVDSDDYILKDCLVTLVSAAKATSSDMVVGKVVRLQNGNFTAAPDTAWLSRNEILDCAKGREKLFRSKFYHGKLIASTLLKSESRLMVDGLLYADGPFVSKLYVEAQKIALITDSVVVWRKREDQEAASITDRKHEISTLGDHIRSLNLALDNTIESSEPAYFSALADTDSRRPVWHLFPGWKAGIFSLGFLSDFYDVTGGYYRRLADIELKQQPKQEAVLVRSLVRQNKPTFLLFSFLIFLAYQAKRGKEFLRATSREILPLSWIRKYRKWVPNYVGHKVFRQLVKCVPQHKNMFVFESFFGKSYSGNPKYLYEELKSTYPQYTCVWVYSDQPHEIPGCAIQVKRGSYEYFYFLARSKYWVNNIQFPVHEKPKGVVYVQTWHGTPLKRLGFDIDVEGPEAQVREKAFRESRGWDFLLAQNKYSAEIFRRCFQYEGEVLEEGYPLNTPFYKCDAGLIKERTKELLGIPEGKRVYLYAPTWRDNNRITNWEFKPDDVFDFDKWCELAPDDSVLMLKYHHLVKPPEISSYGGKIISVSHYDDTQELLQISDCLITDYSSILFDYLNCDKPMVFYAYDMALYTEKTRDMYMSMTDLPGPVVSSFEDLLNCVFDLDLLDKSTSPARHAFAEEFVYRDDKASAERVLERVLQ